MITAHLENECKSEAKPAQQKGQEEKTRCRAGRRKENFATMEMTGWQIGSKIRRRGRSAGRTGGEIATRLRLRSFCATNVPPFAALRAVRTTTHWVRRQARGPKRDFGKAGGVKPPLQAGLWIVARRSVRRRSEYESGTVLFGVPGACVVSDCG